MCGKKSKVKVLYLFFYFFNVRTNRTRLEFEMNGMKSQGRKKMDVSHRLHPQYLNGRRVIAYDVLHIFSNDTDLNAGTLNILVARV